MIMQSSFITNRSRNRTTPLLVVIAACLFMSACASKPEPPNEALRLAESAIQRAEEARVADYASLELRNAREKLTEAQLLSQRAVNNRNKDDVIRARRLAEQAQSDAELATAKAQEARAKAVNEEIERNIKTLENVLERRGG